MAKIYSPPAEMPPPETDSRNYDFEAQMRAEQDYVERLKAFLRARNPDPLVGYEVAVGVADGSARYLVSDIKPFALVHLPLGDAYRGNAIWERGLRLSDVRAMKARDDKYPSPFSIP